MRWSDLLEKVRITKSLLSLANEDFVLTPSLTLGFQDPLRVGKFFESPEQLRVLNHQRFHIAVQQIEYVVGIVFSPVQFLAQNLQGFIAVNRDFINRFRRHWFFFLDRRCLAHADGRKREQQNGSRCDNATNPENTPEGHTISTALFGFSLY
jgi:hypothetical protein